MLPKPISDVELAFPAHVIGKYLPTWEMLPAEFREHRSPWCRVVDDIFAGQAEKYVTANILMRDGIDARLAGRHLHACMGSFEPKHEHKIAGVAYLMSLWFDLVEEST